MKTFALAAILMLVFCAAFPFGKNKIVYYTYDWKIIESPHYRIFLSKDMLDLSNLIIDTAEGIYIHHAAAFNYQPKKKIKIIMFDNQIDFQENNIEPWTSPDEGGFTEFIRGRVVVPYSAQYSDFYHVMAHEITHAFQGYLWGKGEINRFSLQDIEIPLWLIEGSAEFNSIGVDEECEMIIADGLINGKLPSLKKLSDLSELDPADYFYVYKEGQIFYSFVREKYGTDAYAGLNASIAGQKKFDNVLTNFFKMNLEELNSEFFDYLHKKYFPPVSNLSSVDIVSKRLIEEDSDFNMNPVSINSNRTAFISDRDINPSIIIYDSEKKSMETVIKSGFTEDFLEFQYGKKNNLSVSTNGLLCFTARSGGADAVYIYSLKNKKTDKIDLPFRTVSSPDISKDGQEIVFSAVSNGISSIYLFDRRSGSLSCVAGGVYFNGQPKFIDAGRIVFISNRRRGFKSPDTDLFIFNLDLNKYELVIGAGNSAGYPAVSPDGSKIAFIRSGVHPSLMIYSLRENRLYEEIVPTGGVFMPAFRSDGSILLAAYDKNRYNIYSYIPSYKKTVTNYYSSSSIIEPPEEPFTAAVSNSIVPYNPEISLDNVLGGFAVNSVFGAAAFGLVQLSDLLGDNKFQLLFSSAIVPDITFLDYFNADFTYISEQYRQNFGLHLFQYNNYFFEFSTFQEFYNMELPYYNTSGAFILYSYPFTTFDRVEAQAGYRGFEFATNITVDGTNTNYNPNYQDRNLITVSYVHDATMWDITGPIDGVRYELILTKSFYLYPQSLNYEKAVFDFRSYFMILPNLIQGYSFAVRGVAGKVFDTDKENSPFYLGGFNSIRGYDLWSFEGDNMFLLNFELRVPIIYDWTIGFPLPLKMPTIWGVFFWDFGSVWNDNYNPVFYETRNSLFYFNDLKSGLGFGLRIVLLPGIKLMVNFASPFDGESILPLDQWQTFWFIGIDF